MTNPTIFPTVLSSTCTGYDADSAGLFLTAECTGTPPTTANVFQVGCRMIQTNAATGNTISFINNGTAAVPLWTTDQVVATVALAAADLIAMYTTPVVAVAAVTGKAIVVDSVDFIITRTASAFTGGGVVAVQYDSTANGAGTATHATIAATVVTGSAGTTYTTRIPVVQSDIASASIISKGLYISNQTAAFAAGTGTASLIVRYHLI